MGSATNHMFRRLVFYLLTAGIAWGFKYHYSTSGSDGLDWILRPTTALVEIISGMDFIRESGAGYVRSDLAIVIAPACAGVNFLIAAFLMAAVTGIRRLPSAGATIRWVGLSLALAFLCTVLVNALRIHLTIQLYGADIYGGWLTKARAHRIAGCAIYFLSLSAFHWMLTKRFGADVRCQAPVTLGGQTGNGLRAFRRLVPFGWYGLITIGVPVLNLSWRTSGVRFVEHCAVLLGVSMVVLLLTFLLRSLRFRFSSPPGIWEQAS